MTATPAWASVRERDESLCGGVPAVNGPSESYSQSRMSQRTLMAVAFSGAILVLTAVTGCGAGAGAGGMLSPLRFRRAALAGCSPISS